MTPILKRPLKMLLQRVIVDTLIGTTLSVISAPEITGYVEEGETIGVALGRYTLPVDSRSYQWYADEVAISGATASTYTVQVGDLGKDLYVVESIVSGQLTLETSSDTRTVLTAHIGNITIGSYVIGA